MSLKSSLFWITPKHTHANNPSVVSGYCFFWRTVKTWKKDTKQRVNHAPGRVRLTVSGQYYSFSSQWLVTDCLCYTSKFTKETNIKAQHVLNPQRHTFLSPFSWLLFFIQSYQGYIYTSYFTRIKWHLLAVVRWFVSAPHVWWCHKLHDEVNQTLLKVRSCPLLEEDKTATSTLRGWLEGWGSAGGGRAIRASLRGNTGIWIWLTPKVMRIQHTGDKKKLRSGKV